MSSGTSHLEGALYILLSSHLGKVVVKLPLRAGKLGAGIHVGRFQREVTIEKRNHLLQIVCAIDVEVVHHGGFHGIGPRQNESVQVHGARHDGHGQRTLHRPQRPVERQFAHQHIASQPVGADFLVGRQNADGHG